MAAMLPIALLAAAVLFGGYQWWSQEAKQEEFSDAILHTVERSDFVHQITERGEVLSSSETEIRSQVKTKNSPGLAILRVVEEGARVEKGDFLVQLDASALESELVTQQIEVNTSSAIVIEARNIHETALIAQREYVEGTYLQEHQTIEGEIFVAEENLNRAKEYLVYSKKMASKGYVNELQLEADKFAVEKSSKELEVARTKLKVLDEFTRAKSVKQFESDVVIAKAKWEAEKNRLAIEQQKMRELKEQIANCTIVAPRAGIVKYAHENDRRGESNFIVEEGTVVRERQIILKMPDPASMQVEIKINESLIQYVQPGMTTIIRPVGLDEVELRGTIDKVNQYAEPSGWRKANVKEYKAIVNLDETVPQVRVGMTASVTIQCAQVPDAIQVPVQSVYSHGPQYFCFVYHDNAWLAKPVQCGPTNDSFFVVESGLEAAEQVALNPRRFLEQVNLPDLPPEKRQRAVPQLSGESEKVATKKKSVTLTEKSPVGKPNTGG